MINYTKDEIALMFLSTLEFITAKHYEKICDLVNPVGKLLNKDFDVNILSQVFKTNFENFATEYKNFNQTTFLEILEKRTIKCITILSDNYPKKLLNLQDKPYVLYAVGNLELLNTKSVAIVGARNPSTYGKLVTEKFAKTLAQNDITIVSGLASGVDKISHEGALSVEGNTIAVLAGGFDHIFPAMNLNLAREIAKKGLILSEHFVTHKPTKYSFPIRNRIIAGLSDAVLITEAGKKSGSLYTSEFATEVGINTYCIPGNITNELSYSTNNLIKNGGAACATSPDDILCVFGVTKSKENKKFSKQEQFTIQETAIINLLGSEEKDFLFLQEKTGFSTQELNFSLTSLEIRGIIKKLAGNMFILCD